MKKTDLYLKPGTYIKSSTTQGDVQGISLENFVVSVLNNPTCCAKPPGSPDGMLMTALTLYPTLQTVTDFLGNSSAIQLSTLRLGIRSDSSVTTQTSSVIQSTTTNANLVIAPNGTGALVAIIPDGTAVGGNARGQYAVDLQRVRNVSDRVASGSFSVISGGERAKASGIYSVVSGGFTGFSTGDYSTVGGGESNTSAANYATISGGQSNTIITSINSTIGGGKSNQITAAAYSTVSGGESNTASTGTHATVVGGYNNVASGNFTVAMGANNTASGHNSVVAGINNISSGYSSACFGSSNNVSGNHGFIAGGNSNTANDRNIVLAGESNQAASPFSVASGYYARTYLRQQRSIGSRFDTVGSVSDCQISDLIACRLATLNTAATTVLSLDGTGTTNLIIPNGNNRAWNVQIDTIAVVTAITGTATGVSVGDCYRETKQLLFKRIGGTSSIVGTVDTSAIKSDSGMSTASITISAGGSQQMAITFTAPTFAGGGSVTCRVVSKVSLVEVAY
jgi:hypothetical protein